MRKCLLLLMVCAITACEKPYIADDGDDLSVVVPGGDDEQGGRGVVD